MTKEIVFVVFEALSSECSSSQANIISEFYTILQVLKIMKAPLLTFLYCFTSSKKLNQMTFQFYC